MQPVHLKFLCLSLLFILGCSGENNEDVTTTQDIFQNEELKNAESFDLEINQDLLNNIQQDLNRESNRSNITAYDWSVDDSKGNKLDNGVIFKYIPHDTAFNVFHKYNEQVKTDGNYMFMTNIDFDKEMNEFYDIAILPCSDQFELVELIGTDGINIELRNEEIVEHLRKWHEEFGINISYCDYSGIDAFMLDMPEDIEKFANEVFLLSPYVINEDAGNMEDYIKELKEDKFFYLWWGVSFFKKD
jgi:hypothetical protein